MTQGTAGLLASANFLGYLAGALLAATPTLPGSRRRWLLLALLVSSLTTAAMAFASSTGTFLTLRFAGGVASAFGLVLASALVLDRLSAAGRTDLAALHFAGVGVGMALSAVLISSLAVWAVAGARCGWRAVSLLSSPSVTFVAGLMTDRDEPAPPSCHHTPLGLLLRGGSSLAALLGGTFMGMTALGLISARRLSPGDPRRTLAVMTAAFGLGQVVGPTFAGVVYDATGSFLMPSLTAVSALLVGALLAMVGTAETL